MDSEEPIELPVVVGKLCDGYFPNAMLVLGNLIVNSE